MGWMDVRPTGVCRASVDILTGGSQNEQGGDEDR